MGAWGPGAFENDSALDFVDEIETVDDLVSALIIATPEQDIDADEACRIVVVGECVAAMRGHPCQDMPDELAARLAAFGRPSKSLFHHCRDHLAAVMTRGELMELWAEQDPRGFNLAMHDLLERLNEAPARQKPPEKKKPLYNPSPCSICDRPMGEEEFSQFSLTVDDGAGYTNQRGGWVHRRCLNAVLHPRHMIRVYKNDSEEDPMEILHILESKPSAKDE